MVSLIDELSENDFEVLTKNLLSKHNVPGISLSISNQNNTYSRSYGSRNKSNNAPLSVETPVRIASLTKQFFTYIVLELVNKGKIELDTPLYFYLPNYVDTKYIKEVTARHVLSHTTGFPNWSFNTPLVQEFRPGEKWQYSGEGFSYLQHVVSTITGKSLHDLTHEMIFQPLKLTSAATIRSDLELDTFAVDHDEKGNPLTEPNYDIDDETKRRIFPGGSHVQAAGSMWATAQEYTKFIHHFQTKQSKLWEQMTSHQVDIKPQLSWGLGIGRINTELGLGVWQWGSETGYKNFHITFPELNYTFVILTNGANGANLYRELGTELFGDIFSVITMS